MAKFICLQAGHQNTQNNCDPALRGSTGAPGEVELTVRARDRLSQVLISKGFMVQLVDATFNCNPERTKDFDLFLALHGDADYAGDNGGGFVDYPDPSVDAANAESKRIKEVIESEYFNHSGIANTPHSNPNTKFYYMWRALSAKTPCVLLEMGQVQDPHDKVILSDTDRVANAIARGICKAFGVPFEVAPPAPQPEAEKDYKKYLYDIKTAVYGKGYIWQKLARVKKILAESGV